MSKTVYSFLKNSLSSSDSERIKKLLDDISDYHYKKGVIANELLNFSCGKIANKKWHDTAHKLLECGTFIEYDSTDHRITNANFCKQRCCPLCQKRRSLEMYAKVKSNTEQMFGYNLLHIVLTSENCYGDELSSRISQMIVASRQLFNNTRIKQAFKGVARFIEVTYNELQDNFHPHFHCLVMVKPSYFKSRYYIKNEALSELWSKYMREPCFTHISRADSNAVAEVAKYCVKPFELERIDKNIEAFTIIFEALRSRRLVQFFGDFKKFEKLFDESDEERDFEIINPIYKFSYTNKGWLLV